MNGAHCGVQFRILEDLPFVISDYDLFLIVFQYVPRVDWNLATTTGRIDDVLGHGIPGCVAAESLDDFDPLCNGCSQMRRTVNEIALVDVIRTDPAHDELVHKDLHHRQVIVHSL
jgi:hypothetical protein